MEQKISSSKFQLQKLKKELEEANQKIEELTLAAKRALADLINYKRRTAEEISGLAIFANLELIKAIFPIIDNFQRAFSQIPAELKETEWVKGIYAIEKQFTETLENLGLHEIPSPVGQKFDPNRHEILLQGPGEKDLVLEELLKGYLFKDKVIRPTKVKVGDGTGENPEV